VRSIFDDDPLPLDVAQVALPDHPQDRLLVDDLVEDPARGPAERLAVGPAHGRSHADHRAPGPRDDVTVALGRAVVRLVDDEQARAPLSEALAAPGVERLHRGDHDLATGDLVALGLDDADLRVGHDVAVLRGGLRDQLVAVREDQNRLARVTAVPGVAESAKNDRFARAGRQHGREVRVLAGSVLGPRGVQPAHKRIDALGLVRTKSDAAGAAICRRVARSVDDGHDRCLHALPLRMSEICVSLMPNRRARTRPVSALSLISRACSSVSLC